MMHFTFGAEYSIHDDMSESTVLFEQEECKRIAEVQEQKELAIMEKYQIQQSRADHQIRAAAAGTIQVRWLSSLWSKELVYLELIRG